jgi:hypothetical protein
MAMPLTLDDLPRLETEALAFVDRQRTPDKPLGYFRWCAADRHPWSLYASNAAMAIYFATGRAKSLTPAERAGWAQYWLACYHPELGLFICPQLYGGTVFRGDPTRHEDRMRADGTGPFKKLAAKLFELTGQMPPTPDAGTLGMATTAELGAFFDQQRRLHNPYSFGATVGNFMQLRTLWLRGQGRPVAGDSWIEWGYDYLQGILDPVTGMVGSSVDNRPVMQMNGLFKLACSAWWGHERPLPRARHIIDGLLQLLQPNGAFGDNCEDFNAVMMLALLVHQEQGYRAREVLQKIAEPMLARMALRQRADGSFSAHPQHCLTHINGYRISEPLPIGDLLGTGQQLSILRYLRQLTEDAQ